MKYALVIGNDRYDDPKLAKLKTPGADTWALSHVLRDEKIGGFDSVTPLVNQTEAEVRRAVSSFFADKKPDDLVLVYFSGHGVLDDRGRLFLALQDTHTTLLNATAIASTFISDEMDRCRSKRQILILDCCHSGAFTRGTKAGDQKAVTEATFEGSGYGRVVLTASDSTQYALEGDQVISETDLSLFTHFLLKGLKSGYADINNDGFVTLDEWYDYAYEQILSATPKQVPHKWSYHQQGDLVIAKNPHGKPASHNLSADRTFVHQRVSGRKQTPSAAEKPSSKQKNYVPLVGGLIATGLLCAVCLAISVPFAIQYLTQPVSPIEPTIEPTNVFITATSPIVIPNIQASSTPVFDPTNASISPTSTSVPPTVAPIPPTVTPVRDTSIYIEAENGKPGNGAYVESLDSASKGALVNFGGTGNIRFTLNNMKAGQYTLIIHYIKYANNTSTYPNTGFQNLYVNNNPNPISVYYVKTFGDGDNVTWSDTSVTIALEDGTNTLLLATIPGDVGGSVDYIYLNIIN
jgi:hypothetical protein